MKYFLPSFAALTMIFPICAWAKKVSLEWKPIKGAVAYEISLEREGKPVLTKKVDSTDWSGNLEFGVYAYQIRAYDRVHRPGAWSEAHALVVMPKGPETLAPEDGQSVVSYTPKTKTNLKWNAVPGVQKYRVTVKNGSSVVYDETVRGTETQIHGLPAGKYSWQVAVQYEAGGRSPASLEGRKWEGKASSVSDFSLEQGDLQAPQLIFPEGPVKPPKDGKMEFQWKPVDGADAYEVRVSPKRMRADQPEREVKWIVKTNSSTARIPAEGSFTWKVRALASVDSKNVAEAVGAQSSTEFKLDRNAGYPEGSGYAALSTMVAPYRYNASSPDQHSFTNGSGMKSTAVTMRVSAEYWVKPQAGVAAGFEDSFFTINSQDFSRKDFELDGKYRTNLSQGGYPWSVAPKLGIMTREYLLLTMPQSFGPGPGQTTGQMSWDKFTTVGPVAGVDVRKQFSERFSLGVKVSYYFPVTSSEGKVQRGSESNRNHSLGIQGLYWMNKLWGLGMGVLFENRSISNLEPGRGTPDTIYMDGTYFFGSLIYNFGQ